MSHDTKKSLVEKFHVGRLTLEIHYDEFPENPRSQDNLGTLAFVKNRTWAGEAEVTHERVAEILADPDFIALPVYCYSHSGVTFSVRAFGDRWDSGRIGCIYVHKDRAQAEVVSREHAELCLEGEIETLAQFAEGEVYGYVIKDEDGEEVDALWGIYGLEEARKDAREAAETANREWADECGKLADEIAVSLAIWI